MASHLSATVVEAGLLILLFGSMMGLGSYGMYRVILHLPGENQATRGNKLSAVGFAVSTTVLFTVFALMPGTAEMRGIAIGIGAGFGMCFAFSMLSLEGMFAQAAQKRLQKEGAIL